MEMSQRQATELMQDAQALRRAAVVMKRQGFDLTARGIVRVADVLTVTYAEWAENRRQEAIARIAGKGKV